MTLPLNIARGFNRDDDGAKVEMARYGIEGFCPEVREPAVGQRVYLNIQLIDPVYLEGFDEYTDWCILSGPVSKLGEERIEAIVRPSSDNAPLEFEREWVAVLCYDDDFKFPWVLTSLTPWMPS